LHISAIVGVYVAVDSVDDIGHDAVYVGDYRPTFTLNYALVTGGATLEFSANNDNNRIVVQLCFTAFRHYRQTTFIQITVAFNLVADIHYLLSFFAI